MSHDSTESRLARIETKVDLVLERDGDKEDRLRKVERRQWYALGALALLVCLKDLILQKLTH